MFREKDCTHISGGNLATRINHTPNPDVTRTYVYDTAANHHAHALIRITGDGLDDSFGYDANGNMTGRTLDGLVYTQVFNVENRLESVAVNGQTTTFYYDADGNRTLTIYGAGASQVKIYTPFSAFEETVPSSGATTQRTSYTIAGQLIAVRVRTGTTGDGELRYAYGDHLGSIVAWSNDAGVYLSNSTALFEPYGGFRVQPLATVNPAISDRGFTGHRQNNTGDNNLGLIYMNARYYLPEIGRFISADTIVPEPGNPQSYNRYSYVLNSPTNFTDPTGHMVSSGCEHEGCMSDPDTWGDNFVAYMLDQDDRFNQAVNAIYGEYQAIHGDIIDVPENMVKYSLWQIAYQVATDIEQSIQNGGWFSEAIREISGGGSLDAYDVILGAPSVILSTAVDPNDLLPATDRAALPSPRVAQHHIFPQRADLALRFERAGINIHEYAIQVSEQQHRYLHGGGARGGRWNSEWQSFFEQNPGATPIDIYRHAGSLIYEYGLDGIPAMPYRRR